MYCECEVAWWARDVEPATVELRLKANLNPIVWSSPRPNRMVLVAVSIASRSRAKRQANSVDAAFALSVNIYIHSMDSPRAGRGEMGRRGPEGVGGGCL